MDLMTNFNNASSSCTMVLKEITNSIENLRIKVQKCESHLELFSTEAFENFDQCFCKWIECSNKFLSAMDTMTSALTPKLLWHPDEVDNLEMFYHSGDSPWSFWLTYNMTAEIDNITRLIELNWQNGTLKKLIELNVGQFVVCRENKVMFRGLIVAILDKSFVRVLNIDKYIYKLTKKEYCYEMMDELSETHANVIQCCLTKDEFDETLWSEDLKALFQNILRDSRLSVKIMETADTSPPKFFVKLYAFNESYEVESDISYWVSAKLLPALKALENIEKDQLYINIDEEILDPFKYTPDFMDSSSLSTDGHFKDSDQSVDILRNPQSDLFIEDQIQNQDLTKGKPRNRLAHLIPENDLALQNRKYEAPFKFESVLDAPEFSPHVKYDNNSYQPDVQPLSLSAGLENSDCEAHLTLDDCVTSESEKVCSFFSRKGYCWNPGCQKEHNKAVSDNWRGNLPSIFTESLNILALPEVGSEISVNVTHVASPFTFYCTLPSCYSDVGDIMNEEETLDSLIAVLNGSESLKELHVLPKMITLGQIIVAHSNTKNMWLRASVYDIYDDNMIQVFFVDFGIVEQVSLNQCREILPQYIHLPFQAVYCTLSKLQSKKNREEVGKSYLSTLIKDQEITIQVVGRFKVDTSLEVIVHTNNGFNLNKMLVDKGFCSYLSS